MKKLLKIFILIIIINEVLLMHIYASTDDYIDIVSSIVSTEVEENYISIYFFYGDECSHCEEEIEWLNEIKEKYAEYIRVYEFECWNNSENNNYLKKVSKKLTGKVKTSVPYTVIGDNYFDGFSLTTGSEIENVINSFIKSEDYIAKINIPFIGEVKKTEVSLPIVAIIFGFIDGFNPCAMWIEILLITIILGMNNRKKMWILGSIFLLSSSTVYFLSMLGIDSIFGIFDVNYTKPFIGIAITVAGIINLRKYFITRKDENGCTIVDSKNRKKMIEKIQKIVENNSFVFEIIGIIILAVSTNLVELACSLGFPAIFISLLQLNEVQGILKIAYLLLYIVFFMLDDIVVFVISMITFNVIGISNKYSKVCTLISAILMILIGILLVIKPEALMFNC